MVTLNRIYTRTGDDGTTALGNGMRRAKHDARIEAYGTVDETNAAIGVVRLYTETGLHDLDQMLAHIQHDLFDLGADLCIPQSDTPSEYPQLRMVQTQVDRLEKDLDQLNAMLSPLNSFVLPGGSPAAAHLHVARTIARRAERCIVHLHDIPYEPVNPTAVKYINRLSDFLFVAARYTNNKGVNDILWVPGHSRTL